MSDTPRVDLVDEFLKNFEINGGSSIEYGVAIACLKLLEKVNHLERMILCQCEKPVPVDLVTGCCQFCGKRP